jgi:Na+/proline symporter
LADAVTDLLQGTVVVLGLVGLLLASWWNEPSGAREALLSTPTRPDPSRDLDLLAVLEEWSIPVCGSVFAAELVTRIIAARSARVAKRATLMAGGIYLAVGLIPLGLGILGSKLLPGLEDPEQVIPHLAASLLPGWGQAVFAASLAAAILSTLDSTLLVASGLAVENLLPHRMGTSAQGRFRLVLMRVGVVGFGLLAALLAHSSSGILELVEQASALGSSGVLVCGVFGLFTRWGGSGAAMFALVGGMGSYLFGLWGGFPYPYLLSLASALTGYGWGCAVQRACSRWGIGIFARQRG